MKRSLILVSAVVLLFAASVKAQKLPVAGKHTFYLWNVNAGKPEQVQLFDGQQKLQVLVSLSPECPLCKNYSVSLNALQKKYASAVQVTGIVAGKAYSAAEVKEYMEKYK